LLFRKRPTPLSARIDLDAGHAGRSDGMLGMITPWERRALSALAESVWANGARRDGLIVDAGPFVGASTTALAEGLQRSALGEDERRGRIWSYDLFLATPGMETGFFGPGGPKAGESFRSVFDANLAPFADYLRVFEGDITAMDGPDAPVSILFVDILWNWDATRRFSEEFYTRLEPGRSILLHQDFAYPFYPWLVIGMGLLRDHFALARRVPHSTVVFDVKRRPKARDIDDARNVGLSRALAIYDDFIDVLDGYGKGALALGKALFLASHGRTSDARRLVEQVQAAYADEPLVTQFAAPVLGHAAKVDKGTAKPLDQVSGQ
jgi:hypothetical protein